MFDRHIHDDHLCPAAKSVPVNGRWHQTGAVMPGQECHGLIDVAVCYRNAGIGKAANASGYAGDDAQSYAVLDQCLRFFTATAKDKRVAALQAQHALVLACQFYQPQ